MLWQADSGTDRLILTDTVTVRRNFTLLQRLYIAARAGFVCQICGKRISRSDFHADHVRPFSKGGSTVLPNGQCLCVSCNLTKGTTYDQAPELAKKLY
jgi:5-methylcytosine-specific restriction endonuclease McrA